MMLVLLPTEVSVSAADLLWMRSMRLMRERQYPVSPLALRRVSYSLRLSVFSCEHICADRDEEESSGSELEESDVEAGRGDLSSPSEGESEVDEEDEEGEHAPEEGYTDESEDEDAGVALRLVQTSTEDKKEKGKHAMNQRSMWEVLLEQRIRCQPILTTAARLPQGARLLMKSISDIAGAKSGAESSLRKLLAQLLRLRALLVHQHPQVSAGVKRSWSGKQKLDDEESMILGLVG